MAVRIRSGQLRRTLYLQRQTKSYGNPGSWANLASNASFRCRFVTTGGVEPSGLSGERNERRVMIEGRYRSNIDPGMRFSDGNTPERVFDIISINNVDEMNKALLIECIERQVKTVTSYLETADGEPITTADGEKITLFP